MISLCAAGLVASGCALFRGEDAGKEGFREDQEGRGLSTRPAPGLETVYFDYDRADLRADARKTLQANAEVVNARFSAKEWDELVLEGNSDERGSEEYNLALGERRANSVKRYLMSLGIPGSKMTAVSYGESRPERPGHDESAWRYNRRVDFALPR